MKELYKIAIFHDEESLNKWFENQHELQSNTYELELISVTPLRVSFSGRIIFSVIYVITKMPLK